MSFDKKELNKKFISFLDQVQNNNSTEKTYLNDKILIVDGLNTFIRAFAVNPAINDDGAHIGGIVGFLKSLRYAIDILKPTRCIIVFDGKDGSKRRRKLYPEYKQRFNEFHHNVSIIDLLFNCGNESKKYMKYV